ncbi:MAG: hypothetical protein Q4Q17_04945 [Tissierellia bacterium]|nr:hypothetical protein [Tissierellia bacterium]
MSFVVNPYVEPNWDQDFLKNAPNCSYEVCEQDGVAPNNYHALSIYPEYFKIDGNWVLAVESRMDTVPVIKSPTRVEIVEFRNLKKGDKVVVGRTEDASEGIYMYTGGFLAETGEADTFAFRTGRSRETAFSKDYDELYEIMKFVKSNNDPITWVVGPSLVYDDEARIAFCELIKKGYVDAVLTGDNFAAIDIEKALHGGTLENLDSKRSAMLRTYDAISTIREAGSIKEAVEKGILKEGIMYNLIQEKKDYVLASSIRDPYTLPDTVNDVYEAQDKMRAHTRKTGMLICLSTVLHTIASGNMTPSYNAFDGNIRPVYIYSIDFQEFSVNKLSDRGTLEVKTLVTNIHDFVSHINNNL